MVPKHDPKNTHPQKAQQKARHLFTLDKLFGPIILFPCSFEGFFRQGSIKTQEIPLLFAGGAETARRPSGDKREIRDNVFEPWKVWKSSTLSGEVINFPGNAM